MGLAAPIRRTAEDCWTWLIGLLPQSRWVDIWRRRTARHVRVLRGLAEEVARVDGRAFDAIDDSDPRTCSAVRPTR